MTRFVSEKTGAKMREELGYNRSFAILAIVVLGIVAILYWPIIHANFVWDDVVDFQEKAWLRSGDDWKHYILKDFNYWTNYFRPIGVAFFTLQVRLFNGAPGPMHAFSLVVHLVNTFLVGLVSLRAYEYVFSNSQAITKRIYYVTGAMLFYGIHPVLIEPTAWIGSQFDLVLTTLILLGLLARLRLRNIIFRALMIAFLFFIAACTKESAISFPLILLVFDWLLIDKTTNQSMYLNSRALIRNNWSVYVAIGAAGIGYLALRHWALGKIVDPFAPSALSAIARLQEVCFLYMHYWKTLLLPMTAMSPIHPVNELQFNQVTELSLLTDVAAMGLIFTGFCLAAKRSPALGCMILAVTAALLPVLHIASPNFDSSLYHERYVMTALASACPMIPLAIMALRSSSRVRRPIPLLLASITALWLIMAAIEIRSTLPHWSDNINLWRWAVAEYPSSVEANDGLLSAYIDSKDYGDAHNLINKLLVDRIDCTNCMLNAAILDVSENNPTDAAKALEHVKNSQEILVDKKMFGMYLLTTGQMLIQQGNFGDADGALRAAASIEPLDPQPRISLAIALALQGKVEEAQKVGDVGLLMLPPSERDAQREKLYEIIASNKKST
jgi:tetratricopeptide (TPR) repeat protein